MKMKILVAVLAVIFNLTFSANVFAQDEVDTFDALNAKIKANPNDKDALLSRSEIYTQIGEDLLAIADLTKLIALEPTSADYHLRRAQIYIKQKDYVKAKADAAKSVTLDPTLAEAYFIRGRATFLTSLDATAKTESSLPDFNKAIELDPSNGDFYVNRGIAYFYEGQNQKAVNDFNKATELNSDKLDLISFFKERAETALKTNERASALAGRYFFMMENLRQKNLQAIAAVRFSDQTIAPVKNARSNAARRAAAQKSYLAHLSSERFLVASLAEITKIRKLPFTKDEWAKIQKVEAQTGSLSLSKAQSVLNTSLGIVRKNISILKMLR